MAAKPLEQVQRVPSSPNDNSAPRLGEITSATILRISPMLSGGTTRASVLTIVLKRFGNRQIRHNRGQRDQRREKRHYEVVGKSSCKGQNVVEVDIVHRADDHPLDSHPASIVNPELCASYACSDDEVRSEG